MKNISDKIHGLTLKIDSYEGYEIKTIEGTIQLPAWAGFQSRKGAYGSADGQEKSDGLVKLIVGGDMVLDNPEVTQVHVEAYNYLVQNQEGIRDAILTALLAQYKELQEDYGYYDEDAASVMPDVNDVSQFKSLIGLSTVHLMNVSKDGTAYIGYEFGCSWDDEHGLGFMTHKDRVIKIGGADTSFLTWVAKEDLNPE
jgi:glutamine amidotransferase-like uncharacterized protein